MHLGMNVLQHAMHEGCLRTFLRVCELLPPGVAVPGDLADAAVHAESQGDRQDPHRVQQQHARGHEDLRRCIISDVNNKNDSNLTVWQQDRCSL